MPTWPGAADRTTLTRRARREEAAGRESEQRRISAHRSRVAGRARGCAQVACGSDVIEQYRPAFIGSRPGEARGQEGDDGAACLSTVSPHGSNCCGSCVQQLQKYIFKGFLGPNSSPRSLAVCLLRWRVPAFCRFRLMSDFFWVLRYGDWNARCFPVPVLSQR